MPYFAIGSAIYPAVIFSFIYRINDQKLIGCLHHIFLSTPSSVTQWDLSLKGGHPVVATGRISSTEPNLQNIPVKLEMGRNIRKVFIAGENHKLVDADYSQVELRVLAHMSKDETMIDAFKHNEDISLVLEGRKQSSFISKFCNKSILLQYTS